MAESKEMYTAYLAITMYIDGPVPVVADVDIWEYANDSDHGDRFTAGADKGCHVVVACKAQGLTYQSARDVLLDKLDDVRYEWIKPWIDVRLDDTMPAFQRARFREIRNGLLNMAVEINEYGKTQALIES